MVGAGTGHGFEPSSDGLLGRDSSIARMESLKARAKPAEAGWKPVSQPDSTS